MGAKHRPWHPLSLVSFFWTCCVLCRFGFVASLFSCEARCFLILFEGSFMFIVLHLLQFCFVSRPPTRLKFKPNDCRVVEDRGFKEIVFFHLPCRLEGSFWTLWGLFSCPVAVSETLLGHPERQNVSQSLKKHVYFLHGIFRKSRRRHVPPQGQRRSHKE